MPKAKQGKVVRYCILLIEHGKRVWSQEEDNMLYEMKKIGQPWEVVSQTLQIPVTTCRERYHKLAAKSVKWNDEIDKKLEKAYQNHRSQLWEMAARDMGLEWRAVEDRVFTLGRKRFVKN